MTEEIDDMVQRAESNPDAIIYGTFFTYPFDEAWFYLCVFVFIRGSAENKKGRVMSPAFHTEEESALPGSE
jgi:hypothetical protein